MGWYSIKYSDFCDFVEAYLERMYGKDYSWDIEMTTKKNAKNQLAESLYTMFVTAPDGTLFKKSKEIPGNNKTRWNSGECVDFLLSLEKPQWS